MQMHALIHHLLGKREYLLSRREWPMQLNLPPKKEGGILGFNSKSEFWNNINRLRNFTDAGAEKFKEDYNGSTGWEHAGALAYVYNRFFYSPTITSRSYTSVNTKLKLEVRTRQWKSSVVDDVVINDKSTGSIYFNTEKEKQERARAIQQNAYPALLFMHLHTHPQMQVGKNKKRVFSFFSAQDLDTVRGMKIPLQGMISNRLWLIGRTPEFVERGQIHSEMAFLGQDLQVATNNMARTSDKDLLLEIAGNVMSKYELVLYTAEFGRSSLSRIDW